jgi:hypothetical protein
MAGFNVDCPMLKIVLIIVGPGSVGCGTDLTQFCHPNLTYYILVMEPSSERRREGIIKVDNQIRQET